MHFSETITDLDGLREVLDPPSSFVTDKDFDRIDDLVGDFIARSPFVLIASTDARGRVDISPKGDAPGFVRILDDRWLAIPDRLGNHRNDTFTNVLQHPHVGLIFLIPGTKNTLRLRGTATIVRDLDLRESMEAGGRVPELVLAVELANGYFHCAKCVVRSKLWSADGARDGDDRILAESMVRHGDLPVTIDEMHEIIVDDEVKRLY